MTVEKPLIVMMGVFEKIKEPSAFEPLYVDIDRENLTEFLDAYRQTGYEDLLKQLGFLKEYIEDLWKQILEEVD